MSDLLKFNFEGHEVEALPTGEDGEALFDALQVAKALGYSRPHDAIARHVDPEDSVKRGVLTGGGKQKKIFLREPGMWALVLRANTDAAKRFRRFVTAEVLPAIRRFGRYEPGLQVKIAAYLGNRIIMQQTTTIGAEGRAPYRRCGLARQPYSRPGGRVDWFSPRPLPNARW